MHTENHMFSNTHLLLRALLVVSATFLAACDGHVTIKYTQIGACDAGAHKAFVYFRIDELGNGNTGRDFTFYPGRLMLEEDMIEAAPWPRYEASTTQMLVGADQAVRMIVPPGMKKSPVTFIVFRRQLVDPDGSKQANETAYFLSYERDADLDPPVAVTKANATQTRWPDTSNCSKILPPPQTCNGCHTNDPSKLLLRKSSATSIEPSP